MEYMYSNEYSLRGFIALIPAILLSGLLLLSIEAAGFAGYLVHQAVSDEKSYRIAQSAAFSCAIFALSRLDADRLRFRNIGTTTIELSDAECGIVSASTTGDTAQAYTFGSSRNSIVPIFFTATRASSTTSFRLTTWTEY